MLQALMAYLLRGHPVEASHYVWGLLGVLARPWLTQLGWADCHPLRVACGLVHPSQRLRCADASTPTPESESSASGARRWVVVIIYGDLS